jgi:hypothetical protein
MLVVVVVVVRLWLFIFAPLQNAPLPEVEKNRSIRAHLLSLVCNRKHPT